MGWRFMAIKRGLNEFRCIRLIYLENGERCCIDHPIEGANDKERQQCVDSIQAKTRQFILADNKEYLVSAWILKEKK